MYLPEQFKEEDISRITGLIKNYPFGMLITLDNAYPFVSHLPFLFEPDASSYGKLIGHMAKDNPHWKLLTQRESSLVVFNAAHGYISPTWYSGPGVPTWNYAVVHVYGNAALISNPVDLESLLAKVTDEFELAKPNPWKFNFPEQKKQQLLQKIVGIEIRINKITGKFKLSQNRSLQEQQNVIHELGKSDLSSDIELSKFMRSYLG